MLIFAKKYILVFPKVKEHPVLRILEDIGEVEVIDRNEDGVSREKEKTEKTLQENEYFIASLDFAIDYLKPFAKKPSFGERFKRKGLFIEKTDLKEKARKEEVLKAAKRVENIERDIEILRRQQVEAEEKIQETELLGDLNFMPQDTNSTFSFVASLPQSSFLMWQEETKKENLHYRALSHFGSKVFFLLVGLIEEKEKAVSALKVMRGEVASVNCVHSPKKDRDAARERLSEIKALFDGFKKELSLIAGSFLDNFKFCRDFLAIEKTQLEIRRKSLSGAFLDYVLFWASETTKKNLEQRISALSPAIAIIETEKEDGEEYPALLKNGRVMRPFQYVTEMFGIPRFGEIDPTPYLALFFILFFGICLTDAGYGAVIIVFTLLPLLFMKNLFKDTKLPTLLFYGGISTMVMGVLFGSYFGAPANVLGKYPWLLKLKKLDPIQDTLLFMALSFALGYLQVFFAQIVRVVSGIKNRNKEMLLQGIAWGLSYIALCVFAISMLKAPALKTISVGLLIVAGTFLLLVESSGQKIFLRPLVGGVKVLQGLIGTVSDVLSYSRLVALGLATSVIALIVNQIAFLLGGMIPYVGWLFTILVLIGGHIFNMAINALGAFIHSSRLQFVEFFPKFLEGGGRRFKPTRSELKYIKFT